MQLVPVATQSPFDAIRLVKDDGPEYWSARDLQKPLGYVEWRKFEDSIERAKISCEVNGQAILDHFGGAAKMVTLGSGAQREVVDYWLTRYACYLVAMNGDVRKPEIAAAQAYFAIQTYKAEQQQAQPQKELSRKELALMIVEAEEEKERLQQTIEEQAPMVEGYQALMDTKGCVTVDQLAKTLGKPWGEHKLFRFLREQGILISVKGSPEWNTPYQRYLNAGYFKVVNPTPKGMTHVVQKTVFTLQGVDWFLKKYKPTQQLALLQEAQ